MLRFITHPAVITGCATASLVLTNPDNTKFDICFRKLVYYKIFNLSNSNNLLDVLYNIPANIAAEAYINRCDKNINNYFIFKTGIARHRGVFSNIIGEFKFLGIAGNWYYLSKSEE
jgi:hypothetical protein